jgi:hypothetical protein
MMTTQDFISGYADYADVLEAPRILHEIVAIQLVAAALNRNGVVIPLGSVQHSLDLWALLLSGSGVGRSTIIGMAAPILKAAELQDLERSVVWGSAPSFYQHFAETPSGLLVWGEMAELLRLFNEPCFGAAKVWFTDRYDNFKTPKSFTYRRTGKKQDTPPIEFHQAPRINILATSSEDWFFRNLAETDSAGGFLARWVIVKANEERRDVPIPRAPDASLIGPLSGRLQQIGELEGEADLSAILQAYRAWYGDTKSRFQRQANPALATVYFNRHRGHVAKLAVIFEAARSGTLKVSPEAWGRAVEFAGRVERSIFDLLPTGMSATGFDLQRIEERIKRAGPGGLAQNELTRAFQYMKAYERDRAVETLVAGETIRVGSRPTGGRTKTVYVHESFVRPQTVEPRSPNASAAAVSVGVEKEEVSSLEEFAEDPDDLTQGVVQ